MDAGKDQSDEIDKREAYLEKFLDDPVNIAEAVLQGNDFASIAR